MENLPINVLDGFVLIVLLLSGLLAFLKGFVHGVLSLVSWAGGGAAAWFGTDYVKPYARQIITVEWIADIAAGMALFLLGLFALSIVAKALSGLIQQSGMNSLDRSLGLLFGLVRGAVIIGALFVFIVNVIWDPIDRPAWIKDAKSTPLIDKTVAWAQGVAPKEMTAVDKAARDAANTAAQGIEAKKAFDKLTQPKPAQTDPAQKTDPGYSPSERQGLDRLFQTN